MSLSQSVYLGPALADSTSTRLIMQKIIIIFFINLGTPDSRAKIFNIMYAPNISLSVSFHLDVVLGNSGLLSVLFMFIAVAEPIMKPKNMARTPR